RTRANNVRSLFSHELCNFSANSWAEDQRDANELGFYVGRVAWVDPSRLTDRAKPCPLISPPGVPGTRVCLMFYLGSIASQNRIHPTPRSYREWPAYQESFISF